MKYTIDDIARYAEGAMEDREKALFEQNLATDPELRKELESYYDFRSSVRMGIQRDQDESFLKETLSDMRGQYFSKQAKVISLRKIILRTIPAAAAAILILFIWAPWKHNLYQQFSGIEMQGITERDGKADTLMVSAEKAFNDKDFKTARGYLYQINQEHPENSMFTFYYGVTLMELDSLQKSRQLFEELFNGKSIYKNEAAFYLALTYIKEKNNPMAIQWLQKINPDAGNYKKTEKLLNKLK